MDEPLNREVNEFDSLRSDATAELKHLRSDLARLDSAHHDAVERVMSNNNDTTARAQMENTEEKIRDLKRAISEYRKDVRERLQGLRARIEGRREDILQALRDDLSEVRRQQEALQSELIPKAKAALEQCMEEKKALDARTLTLSSRINETRLLEFGTDLIELD
jgi:chromosome segregation ATPase